MSEAMTDKVREIIIDALNGGYDLHEDAADAILVALRDAGFVAVPAEPNEALLDALYGSYWSRDEWTVKDCRAAYRQMVASVSPLTT